jgi:hypothetical protein
MTRNSSSETSDTDAHSRRARLVARRSRRTRIAVLVVILAIAAAAAAGAWAANSNDPQAHAAGSTDQNGAANFAGGTFATPGAEKPAPPRSLDHANPLNLWIGGDSLAGLLGPALGDQVGATGVVKTVIDYRTSSGLWSNDIRNWYQRATDQMALVNPEAVVFIVGANDTPVVNGVDSNGDEVPDWEAVYRLKVGRMMDLLVGPTHRTVFWLGPPTIGTRSMDRGAAAMSQVMREEALKRSPDVTFLDTYKLFSTTDGSYSRRILDENGQEFTARIGDGVHFTTAGAEYLARAVFALVDARWRLLKQADTADPIGWNFVAGSGEVVPGYSSTPRSRYTQGPNQYSGTTAPSVSATTFVLEPTTAATLAPTTVASTAPPATSAPSTAPPPTSPPTTAHTTTTHP